MMSSFEIFFSLHYIKQIDSMLLCICSVTDHRKHQNVVTLPYDSCAAFLFLPHFDVICDVLLDRFMTTWNSLTYKRRPQTR